MSPLDYTKSQMPRRVSRTAIAAFVIAVLSSPLTAHRIIRELHRPDPVRVAVITMGIAFCAPIVALLRVSLGRTVRGAGWAWAGLIFSVIGWGLLLLVAFNFPPVGGADH